MALPLHIVLVRHGESEGNAANRAARGGDRSLIEHEAFTALIPARWRLTATGRQQAPAAGQFIQAHTPDVRFDRFYTSGYVRAMETAALLGMPDAEWMINHYLRERDWGRIDGIAAAERELAMTGRREAPLWWRPPGGETLAEVALRLHNVLSTLHRESESGALLVCHGEVIEAFRVLLERTSDEQFTAMSADTHVANCAVVHYTRVDPVSGDVAPYMRWVRVSQPWDPVDVGQWREIVRRRYSNDELLQMAHRAPQAFDQPVT